MQELSPSHLWQEACPVSIQGLLAALHAGSLDHTLSVTVGPQAWQHVKFMDIACMVPSEAFAWRNMYLQRMRELSQQAPKPVQQLSRLAGELCCMWAIVSEVSPWGCMGSQGQHYPEHGRWAPEAHHHSCLVRARSHLGIYIDSAMPVLKFIRAQLLTCASQTHL